jgi:hypothetical protein
MQHFSEYMPLGECSGVVYGVTANTSSSSSPPPSDVSFQLSTETWTGKTEVWRQSIAATIDGSGTYGGETITTSDVQISVDRNPSTSTGRRLLQQDPVPATLNVGVNVPRSQDVGSVKALFATGPARETFRTRLVASDFVVSCMA